MAEQPNISPDAESLALSLEMLFDDLQSAGFSRDRLGVPLRLKVMALLQHVPVGTTAAEFKFKLAALVCQNGAEQDKFYAVFDALAARFQAQKTEIPVAPRPVDDTAKESPIVPPPPPRDPEKTHAATAPPPVGQHKSDTVKAARTGPITVELNFRDDGYRPWNLPELESVVRPMREKEPTGAEEWDIPASIRQIIKAGGAPDFARRRRKKAPQYLLLIEQKSVRDHLAGFYADLAQELSRRDLDAEYFFYDRTPRTCWKDRRDPSSYTTLENLNAVFPSSRLILIGEPDGLLDIRQEYNEKTKETTTRTHLYPSPLAFQICEDWPVAALLNTRSTGLWGETEQALHRLLPIAPATVAGLGSLMEQWKNRISYRPNYWKIEKTEPIPPSFQHSDRTPEAIQRDIKSLKVYLGRQGFTWLCAISVYPEIYWQLTKILHDEAISSKDVPDESLRTQLWHLHLLRLGRLEWLRHGSIPAEYRHELRKGLPDVNAADVRRQLLEVLNLHENRPPQGSYAEKDRAYTVALFDHERYVLLEKPDNIRLGALEEKFQQEVEAAGVAASDIEDAVGRSLFRRLPDLPVKTIQYFWVLWVDDTVDNNDKFQAEMSATGKFEFVNVTHTEKALETLKSQLFDLIISDVSRFGDKESGLKMMRKFKETGVIIPTIFFTHPNYVSRHREELLRLGADDAITGFDNLRPRLLDYFEKKQEKNKSALENIHFWEGVQEKARAVCRIVLADGSLDTGFLTPGNYLYTAQYSLANREQVVGAAVEFNVENDADGKPKQVYSYKLDPDDFISSLVGGSPGFTRVKVIDRPDAPLSQWGYIELEMSALPVSGEQLYRVHHAFGGPKQMDAEVALGVDGGFLYFGENQPGKPGAGGAPLLNKQLKAVAMHLARLENKPILGVTRTAGQALLMTMVGELANVPTAEDQDMTLEKQASTLYELGLNAAKTKDYTAAHVHFRTAQAVYNRLKDGAGIANVLYEEGKVYRTEGKLEDALENFQTALANYSRLGFRAQEVYVQMDLGALLVQLGDYTRSEQYYEEALDNLEGLYSDVAPETFEILLALGDVFRKKGDFRNAEERTLRVLNAIQRTNDAQSELESFGVPANLVYEIRALTQLGELHFEQGNAQQAIDYWHEASEKTVVVPERARLLEKCAEAEVKLGLREKAIETLHEAFDLYREIATDKDEMIRVQNRMDALRAENREAPTSGAAPPESPNEGSTRPQVSRQTVYELILEGKIEDALDLLRSVAPESLINDTLHLKARYVTLMRENIKGTLEQSDFSTQRNQITNGVLSLTDEMLPPQENFKQWPGLKKSVIVEYIEKDELQNALDALYRGLPQDQIADVVLLSGQLSQLNNEIVRGTISTDFYSREKIRIAQAVLHVADDLPVSDESPGKEDIDKQAIKQLIAENKLRRALEQLRLAMPDENAVVMLLSQLTTLERDKARDVISSSDATMTWTRIADATLSLVNTLDDAPRQTEKYAKKAPPKK